MNDLHFLLFRQNDGYFVPPEYKQVPIRLRSIPTYRQWKNPAEVVAKALAQIGGSGTSRQICNSFDEEVPIGVVNHHLKALLEQNRAKRFVGAGGVSVNGGAKSALWVLVS